MLLPFGFTHREGGEEGGRKKRKTEKTLAMKGTVTLQRKKQQQICPSVSAVVIDGGVCALEEAAAVIPRMQPSRAPPRIAK